MTELQFLSAFFAGLCVGWILCYLYVRAEI